VAASLCAFIVAAALIWKPRPRQTMPLHTSERPRPVLRAWSPEPPVPKVAFVTD
jgi:hypothetical protein